MNMKNRIELIHFLSEELYETSLRYEKVKSENRYPVAGCNIARFDCKEALERRIKVLREELLELSKQV